MNGRSVPSEIHAFGYVPSRPSDTEAEPGSPSSRQRLRLAGRRRRRSVRNVIEYRSSATAGMLCCHALRLGPARTYADLGSRTCSKTRRWSPWPRWKRNRQADPKDTHHLSEHGRISVPTDCGAGWITGEQALGQPFVRDAEQLGAPTAQVRERPRDGITRGDRCCLEVLAHPVMTNRPARDLPVHANLAVGILGHAAQQLLLLRFGEQVGTYASRAAAPGSHACAPSTAPRSRPAGRQARAGVSVDRTRPPTTGARRCSRGRSEGDGENVAGLGVRMVNARRSKGRSPAGAASVPIAAPTG
jgi:hypothetical protein